MRNPSGGTWLAILLVATMVVIAGLVGWWVWTQAQDMPIGTHGKIALGIGAACSIALAIVLMALVAKSSRGRWDDEAGRD